MLQLMPIVWCAVLVIVLVAELTIEVRLLPLVFAAITALALSLAGTQPWLQVAMFSLFGLLLQSCAVIARRSGRHDCAEFAVIVEVDTTNADCIVLYQGQLFRAEPGCMMLYPRVGLPVHVLGIDKQPGCGKIFKICPLGE